MFTSRHYKEVASLIREMDVEDGLRRSISYLFEEFFEKDNERFRRDVWRRETGVDGVAERNGSDAKSDDGQTAIGDER